MIHAGSNGKVFFFKGKPDRTFEPAESIHLTTGEELHIRNLSSVTAFDWNADGHPDLLSLSAQEVLFFEGDGQGRFEPGVPIRSKGKDVGSNLTTLEIVDWDKDGHLDFLIGSTLGGVFFYPGTGKRTGDEALRAPVTFLPPMRSSHQTLDRYEDPRRMTYATPGAARRTRIQVCDWNNDGQLDLLVADTRLTMLLPPDAPEKTKTLFDEMLEVNRKNENFLNTVADAAYKDLGPETHPNRAAYQSILDSLFSQELTQKLSELQFMDSYIRHSELIHHLMQGRAIVPHGYLWVYLGKPSTDEVKP